jgi:cytochrome c551/c552
MKRYILWGVCCFVGVAGASQVFAQTSSKTLSKTMAPIVAGVEHLKQAGTASLAQQGEVLLGELNCLSCHKSETGKAPSRITSNPAPDLSKIGRRVTPNWLNAYIKDPHKTKPGSTMPSLLHTGSVSQREHNAEALTHYLIQQSGSMEAAEFRASGLDLTVQRGEKLFHSIGCVACHSPNERGDGAKKMQSLKISSVPLPDLAAKTSVNALTDFLLVPDQYRHGGRMPSFYLTAREAKDIALYLLQDQVYQTEFKKGVVYEYSEGRFDRLPDFDQLPVLYQGSAGRGAITDQINFRDEFFAIRLTGRLEIKAAADYTLYLKSDDGSRLLIDGIMIINHDGNHGATEKRGKVKLSTGKHAVEVQYFQGRLAKSLDVQISGGDISGKIPLSERVVFKEQRLKPKGTTTFVVDAKKAKAGKTLFAGLGCASCHSSGDFPATQKATSLAALNVNAVAGCLSDTSVAGVPQYALSTHQRKALQAALADREQFNTPRSADQQVSHLLATYNCYACHQRDKTGGPDETRGNYFHVVGDQDLGDEGRMPPTLSHVGAKLKTKALQSILSDQKHHVRRHYMATRMPKFDAGLATSLTATLTEADALPNNTLEPPFNKQSMTDGHTLVGSKGLGCINCHDVGYNKSVGISVVNLATVHERVNPGWFNHFLKNPQAFNQGTRMPAYWLNNRVIHQNIAVGSVDGQIDALWSYLSLGTAAPVPEGVSVGNSMVLVPKQEPIVFRTFMENVGPRAIAVGYPESVHVAFDANTLRLATLWRGQFYDAKGAWTGKGGTFLAPLGERVINLPPGPAFALLKNPASTWPAASTNEQNAGGVFNGYQLDEQGRPTFMYQLAGVEIQEKPLPTISNNGVNVTRHFTVKGHANSLYSNSLYYLLAQGQQIKTGSKRSWIVDDDVQITLSGSRSLKPFIRETQTGKQLLLPISHRNTHTMSFDVEISW